MKIERVKGKFTAKVDLRDEWHWNTKQLFVWITADWQSKNERHSVSIWDRILLTRESSKFSLTQSDMKYVLWNTGKGLKGSDITLTVHWDVHPWAGIIHRSKSTLKTGSLSFALPPDYTSVH